MKVGFLITARLKSTRLPEKLLRSVCGRPIFTHMLDRLKRAKRIDHIIVCTSTNPQDDRLVELAKSEGVEFFRGNEIDVLKRLHDASCAFHIDYILNMTADCPLIDPFYADKTVEEFERTGADWIRGFDLPHGVYSYGIKPSALEQILALKNKDDSEVWGRYFTDTDLFQVCDLPIDNPFHRQPELRMVLDYPEDLLFFETIFAQLYRPGQVFTLDDVLRFLQKNQEVKKINESCRPAFSKRISGQASIELKPRYEVKRAAVLGCGSIGQKHIRNLRQLGISDVVVLRSRKGYFKELDLGFPIRELRNWQELVSSKPDVVLVCNPTSLHLETAARLLPHVRGIFIEKPLATSLEGVEEFLDEVEMRRTNVFVGFSLQFHKIVRQLETIINSEELGRPLLFQCQVGQWLPAWHPYEDYTNAYYSRKDLGGGATLTLIHEIHLAGELLGPVQSVFSMMPKERALPLEVDTVSDLMMQHTNGAVSQIHLDFIQRPTHRSGIVSCERGWIHYDFSNLKITMQLEGDPQPRLLWEDSGYDPNQPYLAELSTFLRYVCEGRVRHDYDAWHAVQSLAAADAAFESVRTHRLSDIPSWVFDFKEPNFRIQYDRRKVPAYR